MQSNIVRLVVRFRHASSSREAQCVAVADQGLGIPQDAIPQLFQRFYRAANVDAGSIKGLGIGLYVVKEIVTLHGGAVRVDSVEGIGSTFTISLPLVEQRTPAEAQACAA